MQIFSVKNIYEWKAVVRKYSATGRILFIAGGTDLMVSVKDGAFNGPGYVCLDISGLAELKGIKLSGNILQIGSLTTFSEIAGNKTLIGRFGALYQASMSVGAPQIRNLATIGGNVATSSPAGDSIPALFVHGAKAEILSPSGFTRIVPVSEFFTGPKKNILKNGELIKSFLIPARKGSFSAFWKLGPRRALAISKISLAARWELKGKMIKDIQIAVGSSGPTVLAAVRTEKYLKGKSLDRAVIDSASKMLEGELSPIDDIRSTAVYRRNSASVILGRFLASLEARTGIPKI